MPRVKGGYTTRRRHKKVLKLAKGYFGSKHLLYKTAHEQVMRSLAYAYRDRKVKKRDFRKLWIQRINAACKLNDYKYSLFINGLINANVAVNRKMLAELAVNDPAAFTELVNIAKAAKAPAKVEEVKVFLAPSTKGVKEEKAPVAKKEKVAPKKEAAPKKETPKKEAAKAAPKEEVKAAPVKEVAKKEETPVVEEAPKKAPVKKAAAKEEVTETAPKKAPAKKAATKEEVTEEAPVKKAPAKKAAAKKEVSEETPVKKAPAKKAAAPKKEVSEEAPVKKAPAKKAAAPKKEPVAKKEPAEAAPAVNVQIDINALTIPGLKALCKQYGLTGYSTMKKSELIEALASYLPSTN